MFNIFENCGSISVRFIFFEYKKRFIVLLKAEVERVMDWEFKKKLKKKRVNLIFTQLRINTQLKFINSD